MKTISEQFEIPFDKLEAERPLFEQWERNRAADAYNWTEEAMAMTWFLGISGDIAWETWRGLPNYTRNQVLSAYQFEQKFLEQYPERKRIRTYRESCPSVDAKKLESMRQNAKEMADQLSADWSAQRPPSVFTYDSIVAGMVSIILGRKIEALKPEDRIHEVYP
jgi:hypothetical protein